MVGILLKKELTTLECHWVRNDMRKNLAIAGATVCLMLALYVAWLLLTPFPVSFDSQRWKTCTSQAERYAMHADLLRHHHLAGMTRTELFELLGPPDGSKDASTLEWHMGSTPGNDDNSLLIEMKDDKAVSFRLLQL